MSSNRPETELDLESFLAAAIAEPFDPDKLKKEREALHAEIAQRVFDVQTYLGRLGLRREIEVAKNTCALSFKNGCLNWRATDAREERIVDAYGSGRKYAKLEANAIDHIDAIVELLPKLVGQAEDIVRRETARARAAAAALPPPPTEPAPSPIKTLRDLLQLWNRDAAARTAGFTMLDALFFDTPDYGRSRNNPTEEVIYHQYERIDSTLRSRFVRLRDDDMLATKILDAWKQWNKPQGS